MAKRQPGAFDTWELDAPQLQDRSAELWDHSYGPVARRLLTSATRCYASKGFQATTTRDISGGAGLSPAAMYVHFPSKEAILFEIARTAHVKALDDMRSPAQDDLVERIWHIVYRHVAWNARYHVAARVAQYELANLTPENYASIREIRRETNRVYRSIVADGVEDGVFVPIDIKRVVRGIIALAVDPVRWYRHSGTDSPEDLGEFYAGLALAMLTSTPPVPASRTEPSDPTQAGEPAR
ncbi:TetR/AcrR family transcriptional regulator [Pseudonocardia xinjiangensis]|uniref:TetR/AcrR family transcriptional regulator n=1 Tax=Pseudonocardia xinjiangensis TaxID=75289 RepID=A0ABX1RE95_9PSEU|nr:TetR/AcrR family transcriptional regulator [Pseudonocardia xinjiangensis]NMH77450.1 TetR/AcrR family transcriptional regulator [Pseudonocardia xinjiangensis]